LAFLIACAPVSEDTEEVTPEETQARADAPVEGENGLPAGEPEMLGEFSEFGDEIMVTRGVRHTVPLDEIFWGCPRVDCIPSIDNPRYLTVEEAEEKGEVLDNTILIGVVRKGEARAYPLNILNWHEIVNDEIQGDPILITYCPLCATGIGFEREVDGVAVEFGVSGRLRNNNLIMYDRKTETLWSQITGKAIVGEKAGEKLKQIPTETIYWKDWKKAHPDTLVLSQKTGFNRPYNRYPYGDFATSEDIFFPVNVRDDRLHPKKFVFGVIFGDSSKAYAQEDIEGEKLIQDTVGEQELIAVHNPVSGGIAFFDPDGRTFSIVDDELVDEESNVWSFDGTSGEMKLSPLDNVGAFWFSWVATFPETDLYE